MGRRSTKENKNIYQLCRENAGFTRDAAEAALVFVSADRIEKIEAERTEPHPDEVLAMSRAYKDPGLCNYYCTHECPIGAVHVPEASVKELGQVTLEILDTLNQLNNEKEKMISISLDGRITPDEQADFQRISRQLDLMQSAIASLKLWLDTQSIKKL